MQIKLSELMDGGLQEKVDRELKQVIENILDPNTEATKVRTITIKLTIKPDEERKKCNMNGSVSSTLVGTRKIDTIIYVGKSKDGFDAAEVGNGNPFQREMDTVKGTIVDSDKLKNIKDFNNKVNVVGQK